MKVAVEANMINEVETSIYQSWLLPLLKFNWQRIYDTLRTILPHRPGRENGSLLGNQASVSGQAILFGR